MRFAGAVGGVIQVTRLEEHLPRALQLALAVGRFPAISGVTLYRCLDSLRLTYRDEFLSSFIRGGTSDLATAQDVVSTPFHLAPLCRSQ